jgi:hypothetical protein
MGKKVEFGKRFAMIGVISGLALALGVPALALMGGMPYGIVCAIMIVSVLTGGAIILVSSFFGIVLPTVVEDDTPRMPVVVKSVMNKVTGVANAASAVKPQQNGSGTPENPDAQPKKEGRPAVVVSVVGVMHKVVFPAILQYFIMAGAFPVVVASQHQRGSSLPHIQPAAVSIGTRHCLGAAHHYFICAVHTFTAEVEGDKQVIVPIMSHQAGALYLA